MQQRGPEILVHIRLWSRDRQIPKFYNCLEIIHIGLLEHIAQKVLRLQKWYVPWRFRYIQPMGNSLNLRMKTVLISITLLWSRQSNEGIHWYFFLKRCLLCKHNGNLHSMGFVRELNCPDIEANVNTGACWARFGNITWHSALQV